MFLNVFGINIRVILSTIVHFVVPHSPSSYGVQHQVYPKVDRLLQILVLAELESASSESRFTLNFILVKK